MEVLLSHYQRREGSALVESAIRDETNQGLVRSELDLLLDRKLNIKNGQFKYETRKIVVGRRNFQKLEKFYELYDLLSYASKSSSHMI